jgi:hypothetical protein
VGRVFNQQRIRITHENLFKGYDRRKKNKKREIRAKAIYKSGQQSSFQYKLKKSPFAYNAKKKKL